MKTFHLSIAVHAARAFLTQAELELSKTSTPNVTHITPRLRDLATEARHAIKLVR